MRRIALRGCVVDVWTAERHLRTTYPDATAVLASPQDCASYRRRAAECGYGTDTWRLCLEHEVAHSLLAEARGLPFSPVLWGVAHGEMLSKEASDQEEWVTLSFQQWVNTGDLDALEVLELHGFGVGELEQLKQRLREVTDAALG